MPRGMRAPLAPITALLLAAVLAAPARAHDVSSDGTLYKSSDVCTWARSTVNDGSNGSGQSVVEVESRTRLWVPVWGQWVSCGIGWSRPPGYLGEQITLLTYVEPPRDEWVVCKQSDWLFNWDNGAYMWWYWDYNQGPQFPPCATGWYATWAGHYVRNGDTWYGGWLASGNHWLYSVFTAEDGERRSTPAPTDRPPTPAWVGRDGGIDLSKLPDRFTVVGSDGRPLRDSRGEETTVPSRSLFGSPSGKPTTAVPRLEGIHPGGLR